MKNVRKEMNGFEFDFSACKELIKMTPAAYIAWMFEHTDGEKTLVAPDWPVDGSTPNSVYRCVMDWTEADRDRAIADFDALYDALSGIAAHWNELSDAEEENAAILTPEQLKVWRTYVRRFDLSGFDHEKIRDIAERQEIVQELDDIRLRIELGKALNEYDYRVLRENADVTVSSEEQAYYDAHRKARMDQAKQRVGKKPNALRLVNCAWRVCRLISLGAPNVIVHSEAIRLAQETVFFRYAETLSMLFKVEEFGWILAET